MLSSRRLQWEARHFCEGIDREEGGAEGGVGMGVGSWCVFMSEAVGGVLVRLLDLSKQMKISSTDMAQWVTSKPPQTVGSWV